MPEKWNKRKIKKWKNWTIEEPPNGKNGKFEHLKKSENRQIDKSSDRKTEKSENRITNTQKIE